MQGVQMDKQYDYMPCDTKQADVIIPDNLADNLKQSIVRYRLICDTIRQFIADNPEYDLIGCFL